LKFAIALAAACVLLGSVFVAVRYFLVKTPHSFDQMRFTKLTASGQIKKAAISPDGRFVAFSQAETEGNEGLWLRQVDDDKVIQIVPSRNVDYQDVTFSPDGNSLYFLSKQKNGPSSAALYRIETKTPERESLQKLFENIDAFEISADGRRVAFIRTLAEGERALVVADLMTGLERQVVARKEPDTFQTTGLTWSPDGESLTCAVVHSGQEGRYESLVAVRLEDGKERMISSGRWRSIGEMAWLPSEGGLVLIGTTLGEPLEQLWRVTGSGETVRLISDRNRYTGLSISSDGRTIAAIRVQDPLNIWIAPVSDLNKIKQVTHGSGRYFTPSWLPDGSIVTDSDANGAGEIQKLTPNGDQALQLISKEQQNFSPVSTPDGRYLILQSTRDGHVNLWRTGLHGENAFQLTHGDTDNGPRLSPDGKWILYESLVAGKWTIWKVSVQGGRPQQMVSDSRSHFNSPALSPDGEWLVFRQSDLESKQSRIVVVPAAGGIPAHIFNLPPTAGIAVRWAYDGQGVTYVDNRTGASEIWYQSLGGGQPRQISNFRAEKISSFAWSNDGRYLMVTRGTKVSDAVLISSVN